MRYQAELANSNRYPLQDDADREGQVEKFQHTFVLYNRAGWRAQLAPRPASFTYIHIRKTAGRISADQRETK